MPWNFSSFRCSHLVEAQVEHEGVGACFSLLPQAGVKFGFPDPAPSLNLDCAWVLIAVMQEVCCGVGYVAFFDLQ
jgi:hypothetical protein